MLGHVPFCTGCCLCLSGHARSGVNNVTLTLYGPGAWLFGQTVPLMKVVPLGAMKVGGMLTVPIARPPRASRYTVPVTVTPTSPSFCTGIENSTQPALFLHGWKLRMAMLHPTGGGVGVPVPGVLVDVLVGGTDVLVRVDVIVRVLVA